MALSNKQTSELYDQAMSLFGQEDYFGAKEILYGLLADAVTEFETVRKDLVERLNNGLTKTSEDQIKNKKRADFLENYIPSIQRLFDDYENVCNLLKLPNVFPKKSEGSVN